MKTYPEINGLTLSAARAALHLAQLNRPALTDDARAELDSRITAIQDRIRRLEKTAARISETQEARPLPILTAKPYTALIVWRQTADDKTRPTEETYKNQRLEIMVIATDEDDARAAAFQFAANQERDADTVFQAAPGTTRQRLVYVHRSSLPATITDAAAAAVLRADIYQQAEALQCS